MIKSKVKSQKSKFVKMYFVLILVSCVLSLFFNSCQNKYKNRILLADKIEYDVLINNSQSQAPDSQLPDWWVQNIEGSKREALLKKLYDGLSSGKIKAYDYKTDELLSANSFKLIADSYQLSAINKLRFTEKWYINSKTLEFEKMVLSVCPLLLKDTLEIPLFRIKQDTTVSEENIHPVSERIQYNVNINNDQQATINEQRSWWIDNLETSQRDKFIDLLLNSAFSGKFKTFDYFNEPVEAQKLKKEYYWTEHISLLRTNPPYDKYDSVINHTIDKSQITRLRFMEEWYIDDKSLSIIKKVKGINPISKRYRETGEFKGFMPMFWIYTDKKYPIKK